MSPTRHPSECRRDTLPRPLKFSVLITFLLIEKDKTVVLWTQTAPGQPWQKQALKSEPFPDTARLVNWSLSGGISAVSGGDNKVTLWREGLKGEWEDVSQVK